MRLVDMMKPSAKSDRARAHSTRVVDPGGYQGRIPVFVTRAGAAVLLAPSPKRKACKLCTPRI
jgi:hypothetical protein